MAATRIATPQTNLGEFDDYFKINQREKTHKEYEQKQESPKESQNDPRQKIDTNDKQQTKKKQIKHQKDEYDIQNSCTIS